MSFSKLVCYITGAGQGLGRATALRMSKLGAKVVVVDLNEELCKKVVAGKKHPFFLFSLPSMHPFLVGAMSSIHSIRLLFVLDILTILNNTTCLYHLCTQTLQR